MVEADPKNFVVLQSCTLAETDRADEARTDAQLAKELAPNNINVKGLSAGFILKGLYSPALQHSGSRHPRWGKNGSTAPPYADTIWPGLQEGGG